MAIEYSAADGRADVVIDRPDRRNALTVEAAAELRDAIEIGAEEARVVVLSGTGEAFCAGGDLQDPPISADQSFEELRAALGTFQSVTRTIRTVPVPVVARIPGPAMGAGCDIALACDFRVASPTAEFGESFVNVGVVSGDGGSYLLPRLVGEATAKEMLLLGRTLSAEAADDRGLLTELAAGGELDAAVDDLVAELVRLPQLAVARSKQLVNDAFEQSREQAYTEALYAMSVCLASGDLEVARRAFEAGERPDFSAG